MPRTSRRLSVVAHGHYRPWRLLRLTQAARREAREPEERDRPRIGRRPAELASMAADRTLAFEVPVSAPSPEARGAGRPAIALRPRAIVATRDVRAARMANGLDMTMRSLGMPEGHRVAAPKVTRLLAVALISRPGWPFAAARNGRSPPRARPGISLTLCVSWGEPRRARPRLGEQGNRSASASASLR